MKTLVVVCKKTGRIICVFCCNGKKHDFRLFKESKIRMFKHILAKVDTGFTGIDKFHKHSQLPKKRSKKHPLTKEEKQYNRSISSDRVANEQRHRLYKTLQNFIRTIPQSQKTLWLSLQPAFRDLQL